ncbi:MAG TPA: hypothetical protein VNK96_01475 [Fimbriimonadales bacterium]|nr:hypothetical protein [Fimbriimonadales bacterium]
MEPTEKILPGSSRLQTVGLIIGIVGFALLATAYFANPTSFFESYLFGFMVWLTPTLGCLGLTLLYNMVRATWGYPIIRFFEAGTRVLPLMALLSIPIFIGIKYIYPWANPEEVAHDKVLQEKTAIFLTQPFFILRAVIYFGIWLLLMVWLNKWSRKEDETSDASYADKRSNLSAPGAVFFVICVTIAVTDLVMSLEPHWYSTIFGLLNVVGEALFALALAIIFMVIVRDRYPFSSLLERKNWRDVGNLTLTLVVLWAYMSFSQLLITWSGNLPEEITYYAARSEGNWRWFGGVLIFLHFFLPFFLLLSSHVKRTPRLLGAVAAWIVIMRIADIIWFVLPSFHRESAQFYWSDAAAFFAFGGIWVFYFLLQLKRAPLLPSYVLARQEVVESA